MNDFDQPEVGWVAGTPRHPKYHFFSTGTRSVCGVAFRSADTRSFEFVRDEEMRRMQRDADAKYGSHIKWMCGNCDRILNARHADVHRS